jgi:hypothetical protein
MMPIRVEVYVSTGMAAGTLRGAYHVREAVERAEPLQLDGVTWQALEDLAPTSLDTLVLEPDDLVLVVGDHQVSVPVHHTWHLVTLHAGPYRIAGELPTMPGFDPGRALTRPSGEFVLLRDVRLELVDRPELGAVLAPHALVNRYAIERVDADIMLGFFFPGAAVDPTRLPVRPAG